MFSLTFQVELVYILVQNLKFSPIHDCIGPGFDSPVPPFSRILILVVGLRMPI